MKRRIGRLVGNLALVPLGLLLALLLLEGALQAGAVVLRVTGREVPERFATGNLRVLCLGDSHTFGLYLPPEASYPAQLERLWNENGQTPPIEVINMGVPGTNSSRLVRELRRMLDVLAPDVVVVMVGVNDFWTLPVPLGDSPGDPGGIQTLANHSRVYQLIRILRRSLAGSEVQRIPDENGVPLVRWKSILRAGGEEFEMGFVRGEEPGSRGDPASLRSNLNTLIRMAEENAVPLILMNYPSRFKLLFPPANEAIRLVARQTGVPFIDLDTLFLPLCPQAECPRYLLEDHHPTAQGYGVIAETLAARLPGILAEQREGF